MASRCTKTSAFAALCLAGLALPQPAAAQSAVGQWDDVIGNDDFAGFMVSHMVLLKSGKVLCLGSAQANVAVFDPDGPIDRNVQPQPERFGCSAHAQLSDGRVLFAGGGKDIGEEQHDGHQFVSTFDSDKYEQDLDPWDAMADMVDPGATRWYGSAVTLGTGHVLVMAGRGTRKNDAPDDEDVPESYNPVTDTWTSAGLLPGKVVHYYPFTFQLSNATVLMAGGFHFHHSREPKSIHQHAYTFNPALSLWSDGIGLAPDNAFLPPCGSAVMYAPDKVIKCGGSYGSEAVKSYRAYAIDMSTPAPQQWSAIDSMVKGRKTHELLVLPDGRVLVMGGFTGNLWPGVPVLEPEWIDTADLATAEWGLLAPMDAANPRVKHSTAVLLGDGSVLTAGGQKGEQFEKLKTAQIFRPPYLFTSDPGNPSIDAAGVRPVIDSAPAEIYYGQGFQIGTTAAASVSKVALVRLGATTHGFDQNTRYVPLSFVIGALPESITVAAPAQSNLAPPGYYMLFILIPGDREGIDYPSLAKFVKVTNA